MLPSSSPPLTSIHCRAAWIAHSIRSAFILCTLLWLVVTGETQKDYDVRLVGGEVPSEGRVEIFYDNEWGTVCDDYWDLTAAMVVCQQLGLKPPTAAPSGAYFGSGVGPILLDNVVCTGEEEMLLYCQHHRFGSHDCSHAEDAGVVCGVEIKDFELRLVDGRTDQEGRVEVYYKESWGTVCDDDWNLLAATVVCRQLNLPDPVVAPGQAFFGPGTGMIMFDDIICTGNEARLNDCSHSDPGTSDCSHSEDAGVVCGTIGDYNVRLEGGASPNEGRVEVLINNQWGTICDDHWDKGDANVICRQLGFYSASEAVGEAYFGAGTGPIFLDDVNCIGTEMNLGECQASVLNPVDCTHSEDAGVVCRTMYTPYHVRLADGPYPNQGRVEVQYNNEWGTICDDDWDLSDAAVICRQLGYGHAVYAFGGAEFGEGTGPIVLDNVHCTGSEMNLAECASNQRWEINCEHFEDSGVICFSEEFPVTRFTNQYHKGSSLTTRNLVIIALVSMKVFLLIVFCVVRHMRKQQQREVMASAGRLPPRPVAVPNNYTLVNNGPIAIENGWATAGLGSSDTDQSPSPDLLPSYDSVVANPINFAPAVVDESSTGSTSEEMSTELSNCQMTVLSNHNPPDVSRRRPPESSNHRPPVFSPPPSYQESENAAIVAYNRTEDRVTVSAVT